MIFFSHVKLEILLAFWLQSCELLELYEFGDLVGRVNEIVQVASYKVETRISGHVNLRITITATTLTYFVLQYISTYLWSHLKKKKTF